LASTGTAHVAPYPYERVWPAAVRFLRVDLKLKITEKDQDSGYVLFELVDDGKTFQGALELARVKDDSRRDATRLMLKIPGRPGYVEAAILDKLDAKLKDELGDPAPPPPEPAPPPPAAPAADAGPR
jgi:hypothetical protein